MQPKFFTLPPYTISHPFIIFSPITEDEGLNYIKRHRKIISHVIIDSGVRIFAKGKKEYPSGPIKVFKKQLFLASRIRNMRINVNVVIPDYPADYPNNPIESNVEKTIRVAKRIMDLYGTENLILSVQGKSIWDDRNLNHFKKALEIYSNEGLFKEFDYYALGTVCTIAQLRLNGIPIPEAVKWINGSVLMVRSYIGNRKLHVFGLWIKALLAVKDKIDSFDNMKWTRPVSKRKLKASWSAKNIREREKYFLAYLDRLNKIFKQQKLIL